MGNFLDYHLKALSIPAPIPYWLTLRPSRIHQRLPRYDHLRHSCLGGWDYMKHLSIFWRAGSDRLGDIKETICHSDLPGLLGYWSRHLRLGWPYYFTLQTQHWDCQFLQRSHSGQVLKLRFKTISLTIADGLKHRVILIMIAHAWSLITQRGQRQLGLYKILSQKQKVTYKQTLVSKH